MVNFSGGSLNPSFGFGTTLIGVACVYAISVVQHTVLIQTQKGSNKCLFILTQKHSMQIFGENPFINPQNDT